MAFFDTFLSKFDDGLRVPETTVNFNIHPIMDLSAPNWVQRPDGSWITYSGIGAQDGVIGGVNLGKTMLTLDGRARVAQRYNGLVVILETENTLKGARAQIAFNRNAPDWAEPFRVVPDDISSIDKSKLHLYRVQLIAGFTSSVAELYDKVHEFMTEREKLKSRKGETYTLPTLDEAGNEQKRLWALFINWDSWSKARDQKTIDVIESDNAEGGKNQTSGLQGSAVKARILTDAIQMQQRAEIYNMYVVALGPDYSGLSQKSNIPRPKEYSHLPYGTAPKDASKKFMELTNHCFYYTGPKPLLAGNDKAPLFPFDKAEEEAASSLNKDKFKGLEITYGLDSRSKGGTSGIKYPLVKHQSRGIQWDLTSYYFCKTWIIKKYNDYGISGTGAGISMDLYPSVKFSHNTLWTKIRNDKLLARAIDLTCAMKMIFCAERGSGVWDHLELTPAETLEKVTEQGYDMNVLLHTIGYWQPLELRDETRPDMSVVDLMRIAAGEWQPPWYDKLKKHVDSLNKEK